MARRTTPPQPTHVQLTIDQMKVGKIRLERLIDDLKKFDPKTITKRDGPEVQALEARIKGTLVSVFLDINSVQYNLYKNAAELDQGPRVMRMESSWIAARGGGRAHYDDAHDAQQYAAEGIERSVRLLEEAVRSLEEEIGVHETFSAPAAATATTLTPPSAKPSAEPVSAAAITDIRDALERVEAGLPALTLSNTLKAEIHVDIAQVRSEIERPTPRHPLIKMFLESLRDHLISATAGGLVTAVGAVLAKHFGVF